MILITKDYFTKASGHSSHTSDMADGDGGTGDDGFSSNLTIFVGTLIVCLVGVSFIFAVVSGDAY